MSPSQEIPTIDISAYLDPSSSSEAKAKVIEQVKEACSDYGFLQISGHGVSLEAQKQVLQSCKAFFDLPIEQKEALSLKNSPSHHGYERMREQVLDKTALPDDKEGFYLGREEPYHKGFRQGPNQWPSPAQLPPENFRTPVTNYYNQMLDLSRQLLEILVQGLSLPISVLDTFTHSPVQNLKLLHYPPHTSRDPRQFGAGEHTDFGALTILLQEPGKHGLQIYHHEGKAGGGEEEGGGGGEWLDVPARENILIVNIGDMVQKWTRGKYRSTVHRVVNRSGDERYSVPCFYEGNFKATNPFDPHDPSTETVEDNVRRKFESSYEMGGDS